MADWREIMDEEEKYYKEDSRYKGNNLKVVGIEKIIQDFDRGAIGFNVLKDYLVLSSCYPDWFIQMAIAKISNPKAELHWCGFELIKKAKSKEAIPALLLALESEYGGTVKLVLETPISIRSTRKDIHDVIEKFEPKIGKYKYYDSDRETVTRFLRVDEQSYRR